MESVKIKWKNVTVVLLGFLVIFNRGIHAEPRIDYITPHHGSLNGHTLITISGEGFAANQFNFGAGNEHLGNTVTMVSTTQSYPCDIHQNDCHERQLGCYTRRMPKDAYFVRVLVDGKEVPIAQHCRWELDTRCQFETHEAMTPTITQIEPASATPGSIIKVHGDIISDRVFSTQDVSTNGKTERIRRVKVGHEECDIIANKDIDELYGIALINEKSNYGWFKCKLAGKFIGNHNVSFIVEGMYGRSDPKLNTIHVSKSQKLYMLQTYAVVEEVIPSHGSVEGGTELHIRGNYFDQTTSPVRVYVGDVPCEVIKPLTETEIVCRTPQKPTDKAYYAGNRGVWVDLWFKGHQQLSSLSKMTDGSYNKSDSGFNRTWYDGAGYIEHSDVELKHSQYSIRTEGYFLPLKTGDYRFYLLADDVGQVFFSETEDPTNKQKILECSSLCSSYDKHSTQTSQVFSLQAGNKYYFETLSSDNTEKGYVKLGVKMFETNFLQSQSGDVFNEKQAIKIYSTVVYDKQKVSLAGWTSQPSVDEVQSVAITSTNPSLGEFKLGLAGAWTVSMPITTSADNVKAALESLPTIHPTTVTVTASAGPTFTVAFSGDLGDLPMIDGVMLPSHLGNITVTEVTQGIPSLNHLQLEMGGILSPKIKANNATEQEIKTAIQTMFSVRCPARIDGSMPDTSRIRSVHLNFDSSVPDSSWGRLAKTEEPFCGTGCLQEPSYVFRNNGGQTNVAIYMFKIICFAYKGSFQQIIKLRYNYQMSDGEVRAKVSTFNQQFINDDRWHYTCINLHTHATSGGQPQGVKYHKMEYLRIYPENSETFIDEVEITKAETLTSDRWPGLPSERSPSPRGIFLKNVHVNSITETEFEVKLHTYNCDYDLQLFGIMGSQVSSGSKAANSNLVVYSHTGNATATVQRMETATPPVTGTFNINYFGQSITDIPADIKAKDLESQLRTLPGVGLVDVSRGDSCSGYQWHITWTDIGGKKQLPTVDDSNLSGNNVSLQVLSLTEGGLLYQIIPGEMVKTVETQPQVTVYINDIPTACLGNCSFQWKNQLTPVITNVQPTSGSSSSNTVLTVTGTNLADLVDAIDNTTVIIGGAPCDVTSHTGLEIQCNIGKGPLGTYKVEVKVAGKGSASHDTSDKQFTYSGEVTAINPTKGSYGGGILINITGNGFANGSAVTIGGQDCPVMNYTYTIITCQVPPKVTSNPEAAPIIVTHPDGNLNSPTDFTYNASMTATVESVSLVSSLVSGGDEMVITGTNLQPKGDSTIHVMLGSAKAKLLSNNETNIVVELPPNQPGNYKLNVEVGQAGAADVETNNIPSISYTLSVDAIYPEQGSIYGGTRLTIKGSGYPTTQTSQIMVTIGGAVCSIKSVTASQIVCNGGESSTVHKITNMGSHPKYGSGYGWLPSIISIQVGDILQWQWQVPGQVNHPGFKVYQIENVTNVLQHMQGGFSSGPKSQKGSFQHKFAVTGTYHYTSGPIDDNGEIVLMGVVKVTPRSSSSEKVMVKVAGIEATYNVNSGASITPPSPCTNTPQSDCTPDNNCVTSDTDPCASSGSDTIIDNSMPGHFNMTYRRCLSPIVNDISPRELKLNELVHVTGEGFSVMACKNEVTIGGAPCIVTESTATTIKCLMDVNAEPAINTLLPVSVRVQNKGNAIINILDSTLKTVVFKPYFDGINPQEGSTAGGTYVTITGAGFPTASNGLSVSINSQNCPVKSINYTNVVCETVPNSEAQGLVDVSLIINAFPVPVNCSAGNCHYDYRDSVTAVITSITPVTLSGLSNSISLGGNFSLVTQQYAEITIGNNTCNIQSNSNSDIVCSIDNLVTGTHKLYLRIDPHGLAINNNISDITVTGNIASITPSTGSLNGKTEVTISGSVFHPLATTISLGSSNCDLINATFDTITCMTSGIASSGSVDVVVSTNGEVLTGSNLYNYDAGATPVVSSVTPTTATAAGTLTLAGTHFSTTLQDNIIHIGSTPCIPFGSPTASQIQCNFVAMTANQYPVSLLVKGLGQATNTGIELMYQPTLSAISPSAGSFGGGQLVTLTGSGFGTDNTSSTTVTICSQPCHVQDSTVSEIHCYTPLNTGTGSVSCDVVVTVNSYPSTLSNAYTYEDAKTPIITNVQPRRAGTGGGTKITITGQRFGSNPSAVSVKIAGVTCTIVTGETDATTAVCITGPSPLTTKTKISLQVSDFGIASQGSADFEYIDVWSSVWTWGGGPLPIAGDLVVIKKGQTILLDTDTPVLKFLLIQGGSLIFDRKNIELNAEYILVTDGGLFQVGTETDPFLQRATIKLHGHLRTPELPIYGAKVLAVREGTLDLHGRPTPITWTHLAQTANAGTNQIVLQQAVNWLPGDLVVLPTTGLRHSQRETETRLISAISGDGLTLTLNESLTYTHISVQETLHGVNVELRGEVGLLSHSVRVVGSNDAQWQDKIEACKDGFDTGEFATQTCFLGRFGEETLADGMGATIMLHTPAPNMGTLTARIEYVELNYVGQEFRMGRYPIHYHLLGEMGGSYVRGVGIHHSNNRAVNIHGTHNVLIEHNVIYNIKGGAYFLEDGIETGNIFQYNLAVFVRSSTSLLNDDITPASFWVTNPNNTIRHNAAAGGTHFGFWYRMHAHPDGPSFTKTICPKKVPLGEFYNNTAHSFGWFGLWIFHDYFPTADGGCGSTNAAPAVFRNLKAWHCEKGAEWVTVSNVQFDGFVMINNEKAGIEMKMLSGSKLFQPDGAVISNSIIVGHTSTSAANQCTSKALILPFDSGLTVKGSTFINFDRNCQVFGVAAVDGKCTFRCGGWQYHVTNTVRHNSPNVVHWRWEHEGVIEDLDGSLTGTTNGRLVPTSGINPPSPTCVEDAAYSSGVPGALCSANVQFSRFAFNHPNPPSLEYKDAVFTNDYGSTNVPWLFKRLTHKGGWMVLMPTTQEYNLVFENVEQVKNISYDGVYYELKSQDYLVVSKNISIVPDRTRIKPGDNRRGQFSPLTYGANTDGDFFYDEGTSRLSYLISDKTSGSRKKRSVGLGLMNSAVAVQVQKCYYKDCIPPHDPSTDPPLTSRPANFMLWSDVNTWLAMGMTKPVTGEAVIIKKGYWVVADEPLPRITSLEIYGSLEFEFAQKANGEYYDFDLHVDYIFIKGGRFVIGWIDNPYLGQASITLYGSHSTLNSPYTYPPDFAGPPLGVKFIAAFGGLDFHGKASNVQWTTLAATAAKGTNQITLADAVDWEPGTEVVITTTSYSAWQTETFTIATKSGDSRTLTLNGNLQYRHLGENYTIPGTNGTFSKTTYQVAAQVGLLTKNIKVIGASYAGLQSEAFGARVLVGVVVEGVKPYTGFARLHNVEFFNTGQEGFTAFYDPRFSLAFLDVGDIDEVRPSIVSECSFHHGFATAVGAYGSNLLTIEKNVIHHTINDGMSIWGTGNILTDNLVTLVVFPGTYNGRLESANFDFPAGIETKEAVGITMTNNVVAGSERAGYSIRGDSCNNINSPKMTNNLAQGMLSGVVIFPTYQLQESCILISSFMAHKCYDFGIYLQTSASYKLRDVMLVDNGLGLYPMVLGPGGRSHIRANKFVDVQDSYIIGTSPHFDCVNDVLTNADKNFAFSSQARSSRSATGGNIGLVWPSFQSSSNEAPRKNWDNIMAYPAIGGLMTVAGVHFSNFEINNCARRDVVLSPSKGNDDGQHPIDIERSTFGSVSQDSKVFMRRPNVGKVNPADCVDMDCDAMKKVLLKDLDGSFLESGSAGAVIPQSEFEWDGDSRRGLGDYRIPKVQLTQLDGTRIPVNNIAPNKGIIRNNQCSYNNIWQGYQCQNLDYEMLIIESLDKDTEKRRLSPISILGDGYMDLINGPQDHGWCSGYTCQERLSTFMALVATGKHFDIYLSSTNPQKTRFYLLNSNNNQAVRLAIFYTNPQRLDVYLNGNYITPNNMELDGSGNLVFRSPGYIDQYMPNATSGTAGENYYDRAYKLQYIMLRGPDPVDIVISPVVVISFNMPSMTIDEFFGENLVSNLATFLGIDPSRVKIVNIVAQGTSPSAKRRKRNVAKPAQNTTTYEIEVSEDPLQSINSNDTDNLIEQNRANAVNLTSTIVSAIQVGTFVSNLNLTGYSLSGFSVTEPLPSPSSPEWTDVAKAIDSGKNMAQSIKIPNEMRSLMSVFNGVEGSGMQVPPVMEVRDDVGERVKLLGSTFSPWEVTVELVNGSDPRAYIVGNTTLSFSEGMANFTELAISHSGSGYMIVFKVTQPPEASFLSKTIGPLTIAERQLGARAKGLRQQVTKDEEISLNIEVIDEWSREKAHDLSWKGHSWDCSIDIYQKSGYIGGISVNSSHMSITNEGEVSFSNLSLNALGQVALTIDCQTTPPSQYSFVSHTEVIDIQKPSNQMPAIEAAKEVTIKFNRDFPSVVGSEENIFKAAVANMLINKYMEIDVLFGNYTARTGSIIITFWVSGSSSNVDQIIDSIWSDLQTDLTLTFGNISMTAEPYMAVNGEERNNNMVTEAPEENLHPAIIAVICLVIAIVIGAVVIVLLMYKTKSGRSLMTCKNKNKKKSVGSHNNDYYNNKEVITSAKPPHSTSVYNRTGYSTQSSSRSSTGTVRSVDPFSPLILDSKGNSPTGSEAPLIYNRSNSKCSNGIRTPGVADEEGRHTPNILRVNSGVNGRFYEQEIPTRNLVVSAPSPAVDDELNFQVGGVHSNRNSPSVGMPAPAKY